jgi:hypothetical protein
MEVGGTEGETGSSNETFVVACLIPTDGSLDTTFGVNGNQTAQVQIQNGYGVDIAIQPDGKIVIAGTQDVNGSSGCINLAFAPARFLPPDAENSHECLTRYDSDIKSLTTRGWKPMTRLKGVLIRRTLGLNEKAALGPTSEMISSVSSRLRDPRKAERPPARPAEHATR